jgi:hypothetical protein
MSRLESEFLDRKSQQTIIELKVFTVTKVMRMR